VLRMDLHTVRPVGVQYLLYSVFGTITVQYIRCCCTLDFVVRCLAAQHGCEDGGSGSSRCPSGFSVVPCGCSWSHALRGERVGLSSGFVKLRKLQQQRQSCDIVSIAFFSGALFDKTFCINPQKET